MLIGLDKNEVKDYISTQEKDKENPTVFQIGNITNREKIRLTRVMKTAMTQNGEIAVEKVEEEELYKILKLGVRKIKNIQISGQVHPEVTEITDEIIDALPIQAMMEVVAKVLEYNFPTEGETKN